VEQSHSAADIAELWNLATATGKVAARLCKTRMVTARHDRVADISWRRQPKNISALEVISAVDGPMMITSCVTSHGACDQSIRVRSVSPFAKVNESIVQYARVSILQMSEDSAGSRTVGLPISAGRVRAPFGAQHEKAGEAAWP